MSIKLVSVTERTREIGISKAFGNSVLEPFQPWERWSVLAEPRFLLRFFQWNTLVMPDSIILGLSISTDIGLFFGIWPA